MEVQAQLLTASAFARFGEVLAGPSETGRRYFDTGLENGRESAWPSLSIVHSTPIACLPLAVTQLERHEFSSQSFVPIRGGRWLVVVCPAGSDGEPHGPAAQAFVAGSEQGITLHVGIWHHALTVLDRPAQHVIFMWRDGTHRDEQFSPVEPFTVHVPAP